MISRELRRVTDTLAVLHWSLYAAMEEGVFVAWVQLYAVPPGAVHRVEKRWQKGQSLAEAVQFEGYVRSVGRYWPRITRAYLQRESNP